MICCSSTDTLCKVLKDQDCTSGAENSRTHAEPEPSLLHVLYHEACLLRASRALCRLIVHLLRGQWQSCCLSFSAPLTQPETYSQSYTTKQQVQLSSEDFTVLLI